MIDHDFLPVLGARTTPVCLTGNERPHGTSLDNDFIVTPSEGHWLPCIFTRYGRRPCRVQRVSHVFVIYFKSLRLEVIGRFEHCFLFIARVPADHLDDWQTV